MPLSNLQLADALQGVFKAKPTVDEGTVKVTLDKEVTPAQLKRLAGFCLDNNRFPAIKRSGAGVSVVFS